MLTVGGVFDGIGLLAYGLHLAGLRHAWLCEVDEWRRGILHKRFPGVPVYPDVRLVGGAAEPVHVIAGGFPCKGASTAGKREGFGHPETVLWREMARAVGELRPRYVLLENVANILALHDGAVWGEVLGDLAALGYDVEWDCLPAGAVGAPHLRDRVFAIATDTERVGRAAGAGLREGAEGSRPGGERRGRLDDVRGEAAADSARDAEGGAGSPSGADRERAGAGDHAAPDPTGASGQGARPGRPALGGAAPHGGVPAPAADPRRGRQPEQSQRHGSSPERGEQLPPEDDAFRRGVRVEWGDYEPAIRRWEAVHGPAPEPLVPRVDDRGAARVERSRLSALGDGVQVQVGQIVGAYILEREAERLRLAA